MSETLPKPLPHQGHSILMEPRPIWLAAVRTMRTGLQDRHWRLRHRDWRLRPAQGLAPLAWALRRFASAAWVTRASPAQSNGVAGSNTRQPLCVVNSRHRPETSQHCRRLSPAQATWRPAPTPTVGSQYSPPPRDRPGLGQQLLCHRLRPLQPESQQAVQLQSPAWERHARPR